jgi:hypothetical protein
LEVGKKQQNHILWRYRKLNLGTVVENCTGDGSPNTAQQNGQPVNNRQANCGAYVICTPVMVLFAVC